MKMIAAVDARWGIGKDNCLLVSIPEDMKYFRTVTLGHVVVMGRKSLESLPGKKPLKNRTSLILTRNPDYQVEGAVFLHSLEELFEELKKYPDEEVWCIGGESVYKALLPYSDEVRITHINQVFDADAFFPNLDEDPDWEMSSCSELKNYEGLEYRFCTYRRIRPGEK